MDNNLISEMLSCENVDEVMECFSKEDIASVLLSVKCDLPKMKYGQYALYKGDELLTTGTLREIAKERGIAEKTLYHYSTPAYRRRGKKSGNKLSLVEMD